MISTITQILWELHFLEIAHQTNTSKTIIIGNIYRPPKSKNSLCSTFINEFSSMFNKVQKKKSLLYICVDINIDLLKIRDKRLYSEYLDNLLSEGFYPKISLPTRLGKTSHTLIDNIITNSKDFGEQSRILNYKTQITWPHLQFQNLLLQKKLFRSISQ